MKRHSSGILMGLALAMMIGVPGVVRAQIAPPPGPITVRSGVPADIAGKLPKPTPPIPGAAYTIGIDDVLNIGVWREDAASGQVIVRPDGKITLPMGNDIVALGLTTDELKAKITEELKRFYDDPVVNVQVKDIRSRFVYIVGAVAKPGQYPLTGSMTVSQLITIAGGPLEFADKKNMMLISATLKDRTGQPLSYKINWEDIARGNNLAKYNIELRPGDQLIVSGGF